MKPVFDLLSNWGTYMTFFLLLVACCKMNPVTLNKESEDNHYFIYLKNNLWLYLLGLALLLFPGKYFTHRFDYDFWQDAFNYEVGAVIISGVLALMGLLMMFIFGGSIVICTKASFFRTRQREGSTEEE